MESVRPPEESTLAPGLRLLPADVRDDVYRLYAALRVLDDAVDRDRPDAAEQLGGVEDWLAGEDASSAATLTLADLSRRYPLSPEPFIDLCAAFRDDLARTAIETDEDLDLYCAHVGGSVAVMVAELLGTRAADAKAKIATLGQAMQLTNVLRDVDEDLSRGRIYISRASIGRFGFPSPGARGELLRDQIARADSLYDEGHDGIRLLSRGHLGIAVCASLYREILRQIEREGLGRRRGAVSVPAWRRNLVVARRRLAPLAS